MSSRRHGFRALTVLPCILTLLGCAPVVIPPPGADTGTPECEYMHDVCRDAEDMEAAYAGMSEEEQKEMDNVLTTLRNQCAEAVERCRRSVKNRKRGQ